MQAYRLTPGAGIDGIEAVELPDPRPGPGEVVVRVRATSLNYRDLGILGRGTEPIIPLSDGAGEVSAIGEGVRLAVGDRVAGCFMPYWTDGEVTPAYMRAALGGGDTNGMLAEQVLLPASAVVPIPAHMTYEEAATLPCAAVTAWNAMFVQARVQPGQSVLLLGTGGVSIFGLQFGVLAGMRTIITSTSDDKLERASALGAHHAINYRDTPDWERAVLDATNGRGVDVVLEVAGAATFAQSMAATRVGGSVVLIGGLAGASTEVPLVARNIRATRISVGSRRMFEEMNRALEVSEVHPVIDRTFEFSNALDAYRYFESQAHLGKVVIRG
jgi:NADPH:quinone reductase-like Zn-dependent oxidoreductase